jgi:hypothetical protein
MSETKEDADQLQLLRIFYFVMAGLHALGLCFGGIYFAVGAMILGVGPDLKGAKGAPPPEFMGWMFISVAVLVMALTITIGVLQLLAAQRIGQRKGHTLVLVCAAVTCLSMPLGTLLGVFTIIVLQRPSVKAAFGVVT